MTGFLDIESKEMRDKTFLFEVANGNLNDFKKFSNLLKIYKVDIIVFKKDNKELADYLINDKYKIEKNLNEYIIFK